MTFVIVVVVAVLIAGWLAMTFNRLVAMRNRMRGAWADVDTLLKRRADLIPNLVQSVRGYMDHEEGTLERVTEARARAASAGSGPENAAARAEAENALTAGLRQLFAVAESYPDLKANQNVLDLQHQLGETENDIASARRYYNAVVRDFNTLRETFPNVLIAGPFGFRPGEFFELADVAQREAPKVDLGRTR
ncbi:MAG TPA: LemA family protein [Gemmatimonadaceae bacterium]|nr:LemA family protein [Gemmatimonadaceae bacterium]